MISWGTAISRPEIARRVIPYNLLVRKEVFTPFRTSVWFIFSTISLITHNLSTCYTSQHNPRRTSPSRMMSSPVRILVINPNSNKGFTNGLEDLVAQLGYTDVRAAFFSVSACQFIAGLA